MIRLLYVVILRILYDFDSRGMNVWMGIDFCFLFFLGLFLESITCIHKLCWVGYMFEM